MKLWTARNGAVLLILIVLLGGTTVAWGQFANKTSNVAGTLGGACTSSANDYVWPDTNGNILKCVSNVWTAVPVYWTMSNTRVGIGTSSPLVSLDLSQNTDAVALPVGTTS